MDNGGITMVTKKEFNKLLNTLDEKQQLYIMEEVNSLPLIYKKELIEDVIIDIHSLKNFRKVFEYYLADIYDELKKQRHIVEYSMTFKIV